MCWFELKMQMTSSGNARNSGDGTRPTTDGGVDNIGAGSKLTDVDDPQAETSGPAPDERMARKRSDRAGAAADDSAPLGMTDSAPPVRNVEPDDPATEKKG
jgi:hypothetical protein